MVAFYEDKCRSSIKWLAHNQRKTGSPVPVKGPVKAPVLLVSSKSKSDTSAGGGQLKRLSRLLSIPKEHALQTRTQVSVSNSLPDWLSEQGTMEAENVF